MTRSSPSRVRAAHTALYAPLGLSLLAAIPSSLAGQTATTPIVARIRPGAVEVLDSSGRAWKAVRTSGAWMTNRLSVSSRGRIAFLEWEPPIIEGVDQKVPPQPQLVVLEADGRVSAEISGGVQRYTWVDGDRIAVIRGKYREGNQFGFVPEGVSLLSLSAPSGARETEIVGVPEPVQIVFAAFDSSLYIRNARPIDGATVFRYRLADSSLRPTPVIQPNFSSSGRYYLVHDGPPDTVIVYDTSSHQPVALPDVQGVGRIIGWAPGAGDYLLVEKAQPKAPPKAPGQARIRVNTGPRTPPVRDYWIYDLGSRRRHASFRASLEDAVASSGSPVVKAAGKVESLKIQ